MASSTLTAKAFTELVAANLGSVVAVTRQTASAVVYATADGDAAHALTQMAEQKGVRVLVTRPDDGSYVIGLRGFRTAGADREDELGGLFEVVKAEMRTSSGKPRKPRAYIFEQGESILDNLARRRCRPPVDIYRVALKRGLEQLGENNPGAASTAVWSQKAGCSCGCSPGFILDTTPSMNEYFIDIKWNEDAASK